MERPEPERRPPSAAGPLAVVLGVCGPAALLGGAIWALLSGDRLLGELVAAGGLVAAAAATVVAAVGVRRLRRRTEAAKVDVERLARELCHRAADLDAIKDVVPVCLAFADDASCERITLNARFAALLGVRDGDNISKSGANAPNVPFRVVKDGRELAPDELPMQRATASGMKIDDAEFDVEIADGRSMMVRMSAAPLFDEGGRVRGCVGAVLDVTAVKRAEREIHERDALLRFIVDALPAFVCYVDRDLTYRVANRTFESTTGRGPEDLLGRTVRDVIDPAVMERFEPYVQRVLAGETAHYEINLPFPDGTTHCLDISHVPHVIDGEVRGFIALVQDITERRRIEDALRDSEAQYRASFQLVGVGQAQVDPYTGRFVRVNRRLCEITGYSEDELLARTFTDITHPDDRPADRPNTLRLMRGEMDEYEVEKRYVRKDGGIAWVRINVTMIRTAHGRPLRSISVIQDITGGKRAEEKLREADQRKDEFLAMLAHELRNPLAPIRNSVRLLRRLAPDNPDLVEARETIERQVTHMVRLIDDLLDVSRISRGTITLRRTEIPLGPCIEQAVEQARPLVDAQGQTLTVSSSGGPLRVSADPARLVQVLDNLLTNASKFTPPGGEITLAVEPLPGADVAIRVRDTGVGISPEMLPHVFDLFVQEANTIDRSRGGLGVGLTLVKTLVDLHGGRVEARSGGQGKGSEFIVTLPCLPPVLPLRATPCARPSAVARGIRVLLVEDNKDVATSFRKLLELDGHEVRVAGDGLAALEVAASWIPDVALIDVGLPRLDGYEVARRLRGLPSFDGTALVALSGYGRDDDKQRAFDAGFDHHFTKPVEIGAVEALFATIPAREQAAGRV